VNLGKMNQVEGEEEMEPEMEGEDEGMEGEEEDEEPIFEISDPELPFQPGPVQLTRPENFDFLATCCYNVLGSITGAARRPVSPDEARGLFQTFYLLMQQAKALSSQTAGFYQVGNQRREYLAAGMFLYWFNQFTKSFMGQSTQLFSMMIGETAAGYISTGLSEMRSAANQMRKTNQDLMKRFQQGSLQPGTVTLLTPETTQMQDYFKDFARFALS